MEIKIYKQRVKHLLYEQQDDVTAKKMSAEVSLKLAQVCKKTSELYRHSMVFVSHSMVVAELSAGVADVAS